LTEILITFIIILSYYNVDFLKMENNTKYFINILKALSDPSRFKLLKVLSETELCVCEIEEVMEMKQTTVSQQLRRLKEAELVIERKDGWWSYYSINKENLEKFLNSFRDFFNMELKDLKEFNSYYSNLSSLSENERIIKCKKCKGR